MISGNPSIPVSMDARCFAKLSDTKQGGSSGAKYPCETRRRRRSDLVFAVIGSPLLYESKRQNRVSTSNRRPTWIRTRPRLTRRQLRVRAPLGAILAQCTAASIKFAHGRKPTSSSEGQVPRFLFRPGTPAARCNHYHGVLAHVRLRAPIAIL